MMLSWKHEAQITWLPMYVHDPGLFILALAKKNNGVVDTRLGTWFHPGQH